MDDYLSRLYLKPALDRSKPWKERRSSFCLGIRNGLSFFACAVAVIQRRPEKGQEFSHVGQRICPGVSLPDGTTVDRGAHAGEVEPPDAMLGLPLASNALPGAVKRLCPTQR